MKIVFAASEAAPFCKTGGLADVCGALSRVFGKLGHEVALFLPKYQAVERASFPLTPLPGCYRVPIGDHTEKASLHRTQWGPVTVYFIEQPKYFDRPELYRTPDGDYADNDERFVFYSRAVLEGVKFIGFQPDILHCHDWQAALIPAYLKTLYLADGFYARTGSMLTIHNIAYQGNFSRDALFLSGFGWADFTPDKLEFYGGFNMLKAGLVFADRLTTVSPSYARETTGSPDFGRGLEGVLRHRADFYTGILNGIDTDYWNPETDTYLEKNYGLSGVVEGKSANKAFLRRSLGLKDLPEVPLIGMVSRLDFQKGLDIALKILPELLSSGEAQAVLLGLGDRPVEEGFRRLAQDFPGMASGNFRFDEGLAHRIYAGADLFLMPSRYEPCGLGQMIAMRYGTLPVAVRTGGLADTVSDAAADPRHGNGFLSPSPEPEALRSALETARALFKRKTVWKRIMSSAAGGDYSWEQSARAYLALFEEILNRVRVP